MIPALQFRKCCHGMDRIIVVSLLYYTIVMTSLISTTMSAAAAATTTSTTITKFTTIGGNHHHHHQPRFVLPGFIHLQFPHLQKQQQHQQEEDPQGPLMRLIVRKKSNLNAKRKKNQQARQDMDQFNRAWYDAINEDATPDDVFWEEMERQKLLNDIGKTDTPPPNAPPSTVPSSSAAASAASTPPGPRGSSSSRNPSSSSTTTSSRTIEQERSVEATLASYASNAVDDNWLDDKYIESKIDWEFDQLGQDIYDGNELQQEQERNKQEELWKQRLEPWDSYGDESKNNNVDSDTIRVDPNQPGLEEFVMPKEEDPNIIASEESDHLERLSWITIKSDRLERAKDNPKAWAYFHRKPDAIEGYDRMWISAIDNACQKNLVGVFRDYGIQFADNFGDWVDGSSDDGYRTIEDLASYKARKVYEVTGLPCIASRTSFEIEPVDPSGTVVSAGSSSLSSSSSSSSNNNNNNRASNTYVNPRVATGYRFNDIGEHVDYIVDALKPMSDPGRVTRFTSCLCYYDGEIEIYDYGVCDCDIYFSTSLRTFIPMSKAIDEMCKTLQLTFGLEYQKWLKQKMREALGGGDDGGIYGGARMKLRDRVLREGKVLPNDIVDVSAFMDSKVDVSLMDDCASELAQRFVEMKPTKILTVATTGLVIAIPMAKYLQIPCVYARKERNVVMSNTYQASYSSKTVGKNRELLVSKSHLDINDRILIIDDFLSSGSSQEALLRIISNSGAIVIGIGVLIEKVYDSGRQSLSGYNVPIESLVRIKSVRDGMIQLLEEEGMMND